LQHKNLNCQKLYQNFWDGILEIKSGKIANDLSKKNLKNWLKFNRDIIFLIDFERFQHPLLLKQLSKIKDPRNLKKTKHKKTVLLIYGILMFVFNVASRREADRKMTLPVFLENIKKFFPEIKIMPHNDTLMRLLKNIEVDQIEKTLIKCIQKLIRNKKFSRYLIDQHYPIAIDGTQKMARYQ